jgi:hypothetical protein
MSLNMKPIDAHTETVLRSIGVFVLYSFILWRLFKSNQGNRVIQCGSIALMLLMAMTVLMRIPHVPVDVVAWLGLALFLLCLLTMFFLLQQGYRALRNRWMRSRTE